MSLEHSSSGWFEASACTAAPGGRPPSLVQHGPSVANGARIGGAEGAGDCFVGIVEAVLDRVRQSHVLPHQVERLGSILNGDPVDDGPAAEFQVVHEIPAPSRIDDRARPADRRHPMPHLSGKLGRALRAGKLESK